MCVVNVELLTCILHSHNNYFNNVMSSSSAQVRLARELGADSLGCVNTDGMFCSSEERLALTRTILLRRGNNDRHNTLNVR